jgi:hypothetical protein
MKRILIGAGLILVVLVGAFAGYAIWFVRRAVVERVDVRASMRPLQENLIEIEVMTAGAKEGVVITEISMERQLRDALGLTPPAGFRAEPLPLEDRESGDEQAAEFVAKYNRERVRYTGQLLVTPGTPALLRFPVEHAGMARGQIELQHERKIGVGGSIGFVSVTVGKEWSP